MQCHSMSPSQNILLSLRQQAAPGQSRCRSLQNSPTSRTIPRNPMKQPMGQRGKKKETKKALHFPKMMMKLWWCHWSLARDRSSSHITKNISNMIKGGNRYQCSSTHSQKQKPFVLDRWGKGIVWERYSKPRNYSNTELIQTNSANQLHPHTWYHKILTKRLC